MFNIREYRRCISDALRDDLVYYATNDKGSTSQRIYPRTKFIPFQDSIVRFIIRSTLYNSFTFNIFLHDRPSDCNFIKYLQRKKSFREKSFAHLDETFRTKVNRVLTEDAAASKDLTTKILNDVSKGSKTFYHYFMATVSLLLLFIVKEITVVILKLLPENSPYRLVDCFLLGRLTVTGTFTQVSQRFALHVCCFQFIWAIHKRYIRPPVRLDCLEFLLYTCDQVESIEFECCPNSGPTTQRPLDRKPATNVTTSPAPLKESYRKLQSQALKHPLFQYVEPKSDSISLAGDATDTVRFRKNRNLICWSRLMRSTLEFYGLLLPFTAMLGVPVMYCIASVMMTRQGFELNYSTCTNYIRSLDPEQRNRLRFIRLPEVSQEAHPKTLSLALEMTDIISLNDPYHVARLMADIFQSFVILNLTALSFLFNTYIAVLEAVDVDNYLDYLEVDLRGLVGNLRLDWQSRVQQSMRMEELLRSARGKHQQSLKYLREDSPCSPRRVVDLKKSKQIAEVQAQLIDFWALVARYNYFVGHHTSFVIAVWLVCSAIAADYLLAPGGIVYYEVIGFQVFTTLYFIGVVGRFASITTRIRGLYPLIASAMAFDDGGIDSKKRWSRILDYYQPKPIYCFTIMQLTISWHFCLQTISWITTGALIIASKRLF